MTVRIAPGVAHGSISAPPSKSMAHRLLICAALADGVSTVRGLSDCEDVKATLDCLMLLGIRCELDGDTATVYGRDFRTLSASAPLPCRQSGSTLRFLLPLGWLLSGVTVLEGAPSLLCRPMSVYEEIAWQYGLLYEASDGRITVGGKLHGSELSVAGNVSSQFISGLLFFLAARGEGGSIKIQTTIESRPYVLLTVRALALFGVKVRWRGERTLVVESGQRLCPADVTVEGDFSGAAFLDALTILGGDVKVHGLPLDTLQGDAVYPRYFEMLASGIPTLHVGDCPDLCPVLFVLAAAMHGGVFCGTRRLRMKESDRASVMARELSKFGCSVTVHEDTVVVYPASLHPPTEAVCAHNDHRIAMALAVLMTKTGGTMRGAEAVTKSFPDFFEKLRALGIELEYDTD